MRFVKAMASGLWRSVGANMERTLVVAMEKGTWTIDNRAVGVVPYLAVSFTDPQDASYFLETGRAGFLTAEPGQVVAFADPADADFFVEHGLAVWLSEDESDDAHRELMGLGQAVTQSDDVSEPTKRRGRPPSAANAKKKKAA